MGVIEAGNRVKTQPDFLVNIILLIGRIVRRNLSSSVGLSRGNRAVRMRTSPGVQVRLARWVRQVGLVGFRCGISLGSVPPCSAPGPARNWETSA